MRWSRSKSGSKMARLRSNSASNSRLAVLSHPRRRGRLISYRWRTMISRPRTTWRVARVVQSLNDVIPIIY